MTETPTERLPAEAGPSIQPIIETYRAWVETLATYMKRAAELLQSLYAEQDEMIDQLRDVFAKRRSLRHADFDAIFGQVLAERRSSSETLSGLVDGYRACREAVIKEVHQMFTSDMSRAVQAWPAIKEQLLSEKDDGVGKVVAALRQVHVEQEKLSAALSELLSRAERLRVSDLKMVAKRHASRDSRQSAELAALLAVCEAAGRNAGLKWQALAG